MKKPTALPSKKNSQSGTSTGTLPSKKLAAIVAQLDAFADEYLSLDLSDVEQAAAELEGYAGCLECEGL